MVNSFSNDEYYESDDTMPFKKHDDLDFFYRERNCRNKSLRNKHFIVSNLNVFILNVKIIKCKNLWKIWKGSIRI